MEGDHYFRIGCSVAGYVSFKAVDIIHHYGFVSFCRCPADSVSEFYSRAGYLALERTEHQFFSCIKVKAAPVELAQFFVKERRGVGKNGERIFNVFRNKFKFFGQFFVIGHGMLLS